MQSQHQRASANAKYWTQNLVCPRFIFIPVFDRNQEMQMVCPYLHLRVLRHQQSRNTGHAIFALFGDSGCFAVNIALKIFPFFGNVFRDEKRYVSYCIESTTLV